MDQLSTFCYGHPGFHINKMLVILLVIFLGTLNTQLVMCKYTDEGQFTGGQSRCYLVPIFDLIRRCIIIIFLVFMISFLPLFRQAMPYTGMLILLLKSVKRAR
ncbi:glycosyl transferase [Lyophyllum atratum]|nr:glycosyl transferase [Lyophyllum atratum]